MNNINTLPEFEVRVLEESELEQVAGGATAGTYSVCHIDGTTDGEGGLKQV